MSSVNYISGSQIISAYKSNDLSISTKMRLESLGIDPSSVSSETQAQILIAQAEAAQSQNNSGRQQGENSSKEQLKYEAKNLAQKVGVYVSDKDTLEDMLEKISETLNSLAQNPTITKQVQQYQTELKDIAQRASIAINIQKNIFDRMEMVSLSNRLILGL